MAQGSFIGKGTAAGNAAGNPDAAPNAEQLAAPVSGSRRVLERVFGIDLRTLAFFRMGLALLVVADLLGRVPDITAMLTEQGAVPLEAARRLADRTDWVFLSPYMLIESWGGVAVLFTIHALAALAMLVGWRTRTATFLTWFLLCALHMRNPLVLHSGDTLTRVILFWAMFLPLGARFSVDGLAARQVAYQLPLPKRALSFASAGLLLQVALVYWFTAILKTGPEWRTEGSALYYALSIEQYATPLGQWLLHLPWALKPLTHAVYLFEMLAPVIAFLPFATERLRLFIVPAFWAFHLIGIGLFMDIGSFPWVCAVAWLPFLPGGVWDYLASLWRRIPENGVKKDVEQGLEIAIAWRSRRIAADVALGNRPPTLRLSRIGQIAAACFLGYVLLWNWRTTALPVPGFIPTFPASVMWVTRLDQAWNMFSPYPLKEDGWFVAPGRKMNGEAVDLFRGGQPLVWDKPQDIAATYPNARWCKYMMNLWSKNNAPYRIYYCRYLANEWNRTHHSGESLSLAELYFMENATLPDYKPRKVTPILLSQYDGTMPEEKIITKTIMAEANAANAR